MTPDTSAGSTGDRLEGAIHRDAFLVPALWSIMLLYTEI